MANELMKYEESNELYDSKPDQITENIHFAGTEHCYGLSVLGDW